MNSAEIERAREKWAAIPQERKDRLERYLSAIRKNPLGPTLR